MARHPAIQINERKSAEITLEQAITFMKSYHDIMGDRQTRIAYKSTGLAIEVMTFIQMSRVTTPKSVPTLFHGEASD